MAQGSSTDRVWAEGSARLVQTEGCFYNPKQLLQRDLSLLAVRAFARREASQSDGQRQRGMVLLDSMCGTGVRAIRYAREAAEGLALVLANDACSSAAAAARSNGRASGLPAGMLGSVDETVAELGRSQPTLHQMPPIARLLALSMDACHLMEQLPAR